MFIRNFYSNFIVYFTWNRRKKKNGLVQKEKWIRPKRKNGLVQTNKWTRPHHEREKFQYRHHHTSLKRSLFYFLLFYFILYYFNFILFYSLLYIFSLFLLNFIMNIYYKY